LNPAVELSERRFEKEEEYGPSFRHEDVHPLSWISRRPRERKPFRFAKAKLDEQRVTFRAQVTVAIRSESALTL
jgi:hypothetical protein